MEDVLTYLSQKGHEPKRVSGAEAAFTCFFCDEDQSSRGRLYVNREEGLYTCFLCEERGNFLTLQRHFGDEPNRQSQDDHTSRRILEAAAAYYEQNLGNNPDAFRYLTNTRAFTFETIQEFRLGWADGSLAKHLAERGFERTDVERTGLVVGGRDALDRHITIPYQTAGSVVAIRGRIFGGDGSKYKTLKGTKTRLFNVDVVWRAEQVAVVEGEFSAMALHQLGIPAVGVPGANVWQHSFNGYFESATRVYVLFDADKAGLQGAQKVAREIGPKTRTTFLPEGKDPNDWLVEGKTKQDFEQLFKKASGGLLVTVDEAYESWREAQEEGGIKFGLETIDRAIAPGLRPAQVMFLLARTGTGKGHPLGTEIVTPSGVRKWGDLQVGDNVYGANGRPTTVTGVYDRGVLPTYRVTFSDKTSVEVDADHLWHIESGYKENGTWKSEVLSTQELMDRGLKKGRGWAFTIPMVDPVHYPDADLPIEPYTMGALLANGTLGGTGVTLTTPDDAVVERVGKHYTLNEVAHPTCPRYSMPNLIGIIRELGLDVLSGEKFIPPVYLSASVGQRVALLQGLMDGDGSAREGRRNVLYHTTSRRLAADLKELVWSLGGTASERWRKRPNRATEHNPEGNEGVVGIMLPEHISPFHIARKTQGTPRKHTKPRRAIVAIEKIEDQQIRCISVNASDSLYAVGREMIVTHNTLSLLNLFHRMALEDPDLRILFVSLEQTADEWFERARRIHRFYNLQATDRDCLRFWRDRLLIVEKNRLTERELLQCVEQYEMEMDGQPHVVAVDYLGYWARSYKGEEYERLTDAVMALKALAKENHLAFIVPSQTNRTASFGEEMEMDTGRGSGVIEETGDFVFTLWAPDDRKGKDPSERKGELKMRVAKTRHGGKGTLVPLRFAPLSLSIVPRGDKLEQMAVDENHYALRNENWELAIWRHRTGIEDVDVRKYMRNGKLISPEELIEF